MSTYTATHNGRQFTRCSDRQYTHAVIVGGMTVWGWRSSKKLAENAAKEARKAWPALDVEIIEAIPDQP
jgi:hypothetical protein